MVLHLDLHTQLRFIVIIPMLHLGVRLLRGTFVIRAKQVDIFTPLLHISLSPTPVTPFWAFLFRM